MKPTLKRLAQLLLISSLTLVWAGPALALDLDSVLAKHIAARGGRERWDAVKTLKQTGEFTSFSQVSPFTLQKKAARQYHFDHMLGNKLVVIGHDGETTWWDHRWFQEGAQLVSGANLKVVLRDINLAPPLFVYQDRGIEAKLLGEVEFEDEPYIGIELTWPDESVDTWYLDPDTYLESVRLSPGSDFGREMQQRTIFDEFRNVDGLMIPHFVETQWYTRDRVMEVNHVAINAAMDDALFMMPPPLGMGAFQELVGAWDVAVSERQQPESPWSQSQHKSVVSATFRGALLNEQTTLGEAEETVLRSLSYDRFGKTHRLTSIDESTALLDIYEGSLDDDGALLVSNLETDTPVKAFGMTIHSRIKLLDIGPDGFNLERETSVDGGENWFLSLKAAYTRTAAVSPP